MASISFHQARNTCLIVFFTTYPPETLWNLEKCLMKNGMSMVETVSFSETACGFFHSVSMCTYTKNLGREVFYKRFQKNCGFLERRWAKNWWFQGWFLSLVLLFLEPLMGIHIHWYLSSFCFLEISIVLALDACWKPLS